jgi:hypothetical protein
MNEKPKLDWVSRIAATGVRVCTRSHVSRPRAEIAQVAKDYKATQHAGNRAIQWFLRCEIVQNMPAGTNPEIGTVCFSVRVVRFRTEPIDA